MDLQHVLDAASAHPDLLKLDLLDCIKFIRLACISRSSLQVCTFDCQRPPATLPLHITEVLGLACNWDLPVIQMSWDMFKDVIWGYIGFSPSEDEVKLFNHFALDRSTCE